MGCLWVFGGGSGCHGTPTPPPLVPQLPPAEVPVAVAPPRLQALLGRWREKVFALLVQLRVQEEAQRVLQAQVGARMPGSHLGGGCLGPVLG